MVDKFSDLIEPRLFKTEQTAGLTEADIQLAAAILMFEIIVSDGHVDRMEIAEMVDILRKQFGLDGEQIGAILVQVRAVSGERLELEPFCLKLRQYWDDDQRLLLLNNLWIIALADRVLDDRERSIIDQFAKSLNLSNENIERTQAAAQERLDFKLSSL
ncbi:MAG: DnaJ like chaperone protein [Arenicella sp.]|jgi:DnaJ like chaperone protein